MIQSILASEIYDIINGFNLGFVIKQTLATICKRIDLAKVPLILCTNFYLLYQCLVQLGTTSEKRLMINIIVLRQSYAQRKIDEIRWICGEDNLVNIMTKISTNSVLEGIISTNKRTIRLERWVKRSSQKRIIACIGLSHYLLITFAIYDILASHTFVVFGYSYLRTSDFS